VFPPVTDRFTHTSPNRATYDGRRNFVEKLSASISVSGSNTTVAFYVAKNGTIAGRSKVRLTTASAGQPRSTSLTARVQFDPGDYVEMFIANEGGTGDITVSNLDVTV
jgi:CRISPR/Cas system CMR-associated protein Cmr5 small subunit